jgi:hypothetical protein
MRAMLKVSLAKTIGHDGCESKAGADGTRVVWRAR